MHVGRPDTSALAALGGHRRGGRDPDDHHRLPQPMADARTIDQLPDLSTASTSRRSTRRTQGWRRALDAREKKGTPPSSTPDRQGLGRGDCWGGRSRDSAGDVCAEETGYPAEGRPSSSGATSCRVVFGVTRGRGAGIRTGKEPEYLRRWDAARSPRWIRCGAGDTFHGAYAWALAKGLSPAECFDTAAWSAALKVSQVGNRGIPTLDQLEDARQSSASASACEALQRGRSLSGAARGGMRRRGDAASPRAPHVR